MPCNDVVYAGVDAVEGIWVFLEFFIFLNLYFPGYLPGQELAPSRFRGLPAGN